MKTTGKAGIIVLLAGLAGATCAAAQFGPPQGGGGMGGRRGSWGGGEDRGRFEEMRTRMEAMNALDIEGMWAVLNFSVGLSAVQADSLRGAFQTTWNRRASILDDADKGGKTDWDAIRDEFRDMNKDLDQRIKAGLQDTQYKEFSSQLKAYEKRRSPMRGGGRRGPGGD